MGKMEWTEEKRLAAREWGELGGRPAKSNAREPKVGKGGKEVQRIRVGGVMFVQAYVTCGRKCGRCSPGGRLYQRDRPGHGPYWYRVVQRGRRVIRRYIGRELKVVEGGRGGEEGTNDAL